MDISISIYPDRYVHFKAMDISENRYGHIDFDIPRSICPFYSYGYIENGHIEMDISINFFYYLLNLT